MATILAAGGHRAIAASAASVGTDHAWACLISSASCCIVLVSAMEIARATPHYDRRECERKGG